MVDSFKIYLKDNGNGEYNGPFGFMIKAYDKVLKAYDDVFDLDKRLKELGCTVTSEGINTGTGQKSICVRSESCGFDTKHFRRKFKFYRHVDKVEPIIKDAF
jgi:hypothetical protein